MNYEHPATKVNPSWFDIDRMKEALRSERHRLPKGLSPEEIRDYILNNRGSADVASTHKASD